jgi:hypothetical protein
MTGLTAPELTALLPPFARAFAASLRDRTLDGQPRTGRRDRASDHGPVPTMADKLLVMLTYVTQHPMQAVPGQRFGMSQAQANHWIHLLQPVLPHALAAHDLLPARTAAAFAARFKTRTTAGRSTPPLVGLRGLNVRATGRPIPKSHKHMTAARRRVTHATTAS